MTGAAEILVIILAVVLAIFLVLAIVLIAIMIKITKQIKTITGTAERTVVNLEKTSQNISTFSSPVMIGRLISRQFSKIRRKE